MSDDSNNGNPHHGIPGPGGSLGCCAVCGESFAAGVIKDLMGMKSGITPFTISVIEGTLYAHDPDCVDTLTAAMDGLEGTENCSLLASRLPKGPLSKALEQSDE